MRYFLCGAYLGLLLAASPHTLPAQSVGLGIRGGFLGFGGEAALGLGSFVAFRGGYGVFPFDFTGEYSDVEYTVTPPSSVGTLGVDFYPTGRSFRIMGGFMFRDGDLSIQSGDLAQGGPVEIGGNEYSEAGTLRGVLKTKTAAPYVGLGIGRHTAPGFGIFVDFGVAFVGDPDVQLDAEGAIRQVPGFLADLQEEERSIEEEAGSLLKYWPILNVGIKFSIG